MDAWNTLVAEHPEVFCRSVQDELTARRIFQDEAVTLPKTQRGWAIEACLRTFRGTVRDMAKDIAEILPASVQVDVVGGRIQLKRGQTSEVFWLVYAEAWAMIEIATDPDYHRDFEDLRALVLLAKHGVGR